MIKVENMPNRIEVTGHAGYASVGQDIVCSAISTLVQNLIFSIEELTKDQIEYDVNAGHAVITYGDLSENAQLLMDSFLIGCQAVAQAHPEYVRVTNT